MKKAQPVSIVRFQRAGHRECRQMKTHYKLPSVAHLAKIKLGNVICMWKDLAYTYCSGLNRCVLLMIKPVFAENGIFVIQ